MPRTHRTAGPAVRALLLTLVTGTAGPAAAQVYERAGWKATLGTDFHDVAGTVRMVDERTLRVDDFHFDGQGISVFFYLGTEDTPEAFEQGLPIGPELVGAPLSGSTLMLTLPEGETLDDYGAISVWCVTAGVSFGSGSFSHPRTGWVADLEGRSHGVEGRVRVIDERTLQVDEFHYDGGGVSVFFYLGREDSDEAFVYGLPLGDELVGRSFFGETLVLELPEGESIGDWNAISVWCVAAAANFGSGSFGSRLRVTPPVGCPGNLRLDVTGATAASEVALLYAPVEGDGALTTGPCAGAPTGLAPDGARLLTVRDADVGGDLIVRSEAPEAACGGRLQALDVATCRLSEVVSIDGVGGSPQPSPRVPLVAR